MILIIDILHLRVAVVRSLRAYNSHHIAFLDTLGGKHILLGCAAGLGKKSVDIDSSGFIGEIEVAIGIVLGGIAAVHYNTGDNAAYSVRSTAVFLGKNLGDCSIDDRRISFLLEGEGYVCNTGTLNSEGSGALFLDGVGLECNLDVAAFLAGLGVAGNPSGLGGHGPVLGKIVCKDAELGGGCRSGNCQLRLRASEGRSCTCLDGNYISFVLDSLGGVALIVGALTVDDNLVAHIDVGIVRIVVLLVADIQGTIDLEHLVGGIAVIGDVEGGVAVLGAELLVYLGDDTFDVDRVGLGIGVKGSSKSVSL